MRFSAFTKVKFLLVVVVLMLAAAAIWFVGVRAGGDRQIRHIVLISIDTCRADHLGCYGYGFPTTPNIDAVAQQAVVFENAVSPVPLTLPAHTSMLCGTVPAYHGVHNNINYQVNSRNTTLAELLQQQGYTTGAFISAYVLDSRFGLDQGFDTYNDQFTDTHSRMGINERRGQEVVNLSNQWLEQNSNEDFFLFLHFFDPHADYRPPKPFADSFKDNLYDGEIAYTDDCIGQVIDKLKQLGIYESSLLVVAGDHGESLGEHIEEKHKYFIYQSTQHVPLIIKPPRCQNGQRIKEFVGIIDIAPTVLGYAGIAQNKEMQGIDLRSMLSANGSTGTNRYFLCESFIPTVYNCNPLLGIVGNGYKYIQTSRPELYNLVNDPGEQTNLINAEPDRVRQLRNHLGKLLSEQICNEQFDNTLDLDSQTTKRLESLGYVGNLGGDSYAFDPEKPDAKDYINYHCLDLQFSEFIEEKQYRQAQKICDQLIKLYPTERIIHYKYGQVAFNQDRHEEALSHFRRFLDPGNNNVYVHEAEYGNCYSMMGMVLTGSGRTAEAIDCLKKALEYSPDNYAACGNLAMALYRSGRFDEAAGYFQKYLQHDPDNIDAIVHLGESLDRQNRLDEASLQYRRALKLHVNDARTHNNLGTILLRQKKYSEAKGHFNQAIQINPNYARAYVNLGVIYASQDQFARARDKFEQALRLEPDNLEIQTNMGRVLINLGQYDQALVHWQNALRLSANNSQAQEKIQGVIAQLKDNMKKNEKSDKP